MNSIRTIKPDSDEYPSGLNRLVDPPNRLFIAGNHPINSVNLAVVGSRKPTQYGVKITSEFIRGVAKCDVNIVSGLALGIDGLAHKAALDAGGTTTAILPSGLDTIYPASHRNLANSILTGGGLISEYPAGTRAAKYHFPARNRIIAALADAVLVIEAAEKSGTLITVEHALDIGVPVLAVPGSVLSQYSRGTNRLIQLGAGLVTSVSDILHELGIDQNKSKDIRVKDPVDNLIISALSAETQSLAELLNITKLDAQQLQQRLTRLELAGHVSNIGNNCWSIS